MRQPSPLPRSLRKSAKHQPGSVRAAVPSWCWPIGQITVPSPRLVRMLPRMLTVTLAFTGLAAKIRSDLWLHRRRVDLMPSSIIEARIIVQQIPLARFSAVLNQGVEYEFLNLEFFSLARIESAGPEY